MASTTRHLKSPVLNIYFAKEQLQAFRITRNDQVQIIIHTMISFFNKMNFNVPYLKLILTDWA